MMSSVELEHSKILKSEGGPGVYCSFAMITRVRRIVDRGVSNGSPSDSPNCLIQDQI